MSEKRTAPSYMMRIQARPGSLAEALYYKRSALPGSPWPDPAEIAPGISPSPLDDLIFHGGKTVPQMGFRNIYLGSSMDWAAGDIQLIDSAIARAMQDRRLNNVMVQYFPGATLSCDAIPSTVLTDNRPAALDEPDIQAKIIALFEAGTLGQSDLDRTIFNFILPPGTILRLGASNSQEGLGGYHGSVRTSTAGGDVTLYYSANVFSQLLGDGSQNGIVAFDQPWKNVVGTLYHELNEFRTDADVDQAIKQGNNDLLGWASRQGRECGDQPIFVANPLDEVFQEVMAADGGPRIPTQFMYSNAVHGAEGPIDAPHADTQTGAARRGTVRNRVPHIATAPSVPARSPAYGTPLEQTIDGCIGRHLDELAKPGVLSIRPGYQMAGGWFTRKPAIVVTVDRKRDDLRPDERLPETLEGYAVDVRDANPLQRIQATNPLLYREVIKQAAPELQPATFALERDLSGRRLEAATLGSIEAFRPRSALNLPYTPPDDGASLAAIEDQFTLVCHVSPDAGWTVLQPFLQGVTTTLTVGMYQCTSAHILDTLVQSLGDGRTFDLVMDHPVKDRTEDQTDDETVAALEQALGNRLNFAWALEAKNLARVNHWIYPFAYHIKVAVRDSASFWLSSGNWNNSNQPAIDPLNDPQSAIPQLKTSDRDWHVIVEHAKLSQVFESFLQHDLQVADANQGAADIAAVSAAGAQALAQLAVPQQAALSRVPKQFFAPKTITASMKVQPVLTPDNYGPAILDLINSATSTLYLQIPYITPSSEPEGVVLAGLIEAIARQMQAGLDVRVILSSFAQAGALEQLQAAGWNLSLVRIQPNLHNKGIIVDASVVAIGSQNWSGSGVSTNRDASLIIFNAEAAQYWQDVFIHDWVNMSSQQLPS
jgi:hypothetical protein